jgi:hypothetical protein
LTLNLCGCGAESRGKSARCLLMFNFSGNSSEMAGGPSLFYFSTSLHLCFARAPKMGRSVRLSQWLALIVSLYFNSLSFLPVSNAAGPSTNFNPCSAISSGFKGIDSTNRVNYVECSNYNVIQSYECSEGTYFDEQTTQCVAGTWVDPDAENVCISAFDGFVSIDTSLYASCSNYTETGRYSCPEGFYFDEGQQVCVNKNSFATVSTLAAVITPTTIIGTSTESASSTTIDTTETATGTSCENVSDGNLALPSLQGWIVCNDGEILVTEYCGASKLFNTDYGVCVNYCDGKTSNSTDTSTIQVELPKLAGQVTCDSASGTTVENIVCSPGTHFDVSSNYCRNFCENQVQQYISFPDLQGGVKCQDGDVIATEWCGSGSLYNTIMGMCVQTDSPSLSPVTASPTIAILTASSTIPQFVPPTQTPTISIQPSRNLELDNVDKESGKGKKPKPQLIDLDDNAASTLFLRLELSTGVLIVVTLLLGLDVFL